MKLQELEKNGDTISRERLLQLTGGTGGENPSLAECTGCDITGAGFFDCSDGDYVID